jgi:hypothetical protein
MAEFCCAEIGDGASASIAIATRHALIPMPNRVTLFTNLVPFAWIFIG